MKRKKRKKNNNKIYFIIIGVIIFVLLVIFGIYANKDHNEFQKELKEEGYTTIDNEDAFFKKIVSGNTISDYYDDISNDKDTKYEEYSLSKESYDYIELKMEYQNEIFTVLNISSNLKSDVIQFNFELTYNNSQILLDGDSTTDYECNVIVQKEASDSTVDIYCDMIKSEIETFKSRRAELLSNPKIQEVISKPIKEVNE